MAEPEMSPEQVIEAVYEDAAAQMREGIAPADIEKNLVARGLDAETAATVVRNLQEARSKALAEAGGKNMLYGALWCVGGIVVTAVTYQSASGRGGGSYVVAWGAILFGAIQFVQGLFQSIRR